MSAESAGDGATAGEAMDGANVEYEVRGTLAWITLDRPEKLNALAGSMREQLLDHVRAAVAEESVRALVVSGAGRAFCAGGDIDNMIALRAQDDDAGFRKLLHAGAEVMLALQAFPGLTVAAVDGVASGAGLSLALSCDLRLGSPAAAFSAPWIKLGLVPDWGASFWLPRLIGAGRAMELVTTGRRIEAAEALELGLLTEIVEDQDYEGYVQLRVERLGAAASAVAHAKRLMRLGSEASLEAAIARESEAQEACFESGDFREGLQAFLEKRPPEFEGD